MATDMKCDPEPGITALVSGIVSDGQRLIEQQLTLFRREIGGEIRHMRNAVISLAIGAGITAVGGMLLVAMVVHLLHAYTEMPLWGCYGLVGGVLVGGGALLLYLGGKGAADAHLLAPPQTAEALKENVEWFKHPTSSERT
jgi:Putative Actinobacterial Holin-X, holin superfamily III